MKKLKDFQGQQLNKVMMSMLKGGAACASGQTLFTCNVCLYNDCVSGYACASSWGNAMLAVNKEIYSQLGHEGLSNSDVMC